MLTGDKVETAKCISVMSGLKTNNDVFVEIKSPIEGLQIHRKLQVLQNQRQEKFVLLVDGHTLTYILANRSVQKLFISAAKQA